MNMKEKIKGNVLVYARRRYSQFFYEVAERTFEGNITYLSDWPSDLPSLKFLNFMPDFYKNYKNKKNINILTQEELKEIVVRCRVLRLLPYEQAVAMVYAMHITLKNLINKYKPDYFFAQSVEHYISDILCRICEESSVMPILIMDGSIEDTILFFRYGEYNYVREPSKTEVAQTLDSLMDSTYHFTYGRKWNQYSFSKHFKAFIIGWSKYLVFRILAIVYRDPMNFRFLTTFLHVEGGGQSSLFNYKFSQNYDMDWKEQLENAKKPVLYIPLSFTPECSTDYWLKDLKYIDYENFILDLCNKLNHSYFILLKDHWAMLGIRRSSFYKQLKSIPGVILVPPDVNGRAILDLVDRVLVGSGTAGVEAAVRGKRVVNLCVPYYYLEGYYLPIVSADKIENLPCLLENFTPPVCNRENQYFIVRRFLESTLRGSVRVNSKLNTEHNWQAVSKSLKEYLSTSINAVNRDDQVSDSV